MPGDKYRVCCIGRVTRGKDERGFTVMIGHRPGCGWKSVRSDHIECECYDINTLYCRPLTPGPGCPRGINWPCPRCGGAVTGKLMEDA